MDGIDILIPYHGNYNAVRECIGSIFLYTRQIPFQITIIDDGSPNTDFFSIIAQTDKQIDGIRLETHSGFGKAINEGIKLTSRPWIVMLNSDCLIKEANWLFSLHNQLNDSMKDKVGLVSATTNHGGPSTLIERNQFKRTKKSIISDEAIPLICSMMPRKLFDKVGLLKEYPLGGYEDEEFFWRMKSNGYKQAICEPAWVFHHGGLTTKMLWKQDKNNQTIMMEDNRKRCEEDIKNLIVYHHSSSL